MTNITVAAGNLSRLIFGELRSYNRIGVVRPDSNALMVYTYIPEKEWPAERALYFDGHPVRWVQMAQGGK